MCCILRVEAHRHHLLQVLTVDCANGVGAAKLKALAEGLSGELDVCLRSTGEGGLNDGCGADYVQKGRRFPAGMEDCQDGARSATASEKSCSTGPASNAVNDCSGTACLKALRIPLVSPSVKSLSVPCMTAMLSKM